MCVCVCVCFFPNKKISPNNWSNPYKNKQASYVSVTRKLRSLLEVHLWSSILITKRPFYFLHIFMEFEGNFLLNYFHWTYIFFTLNNNFMHLIYMRFTRFERKHACIYLLSLNTQKVKMHFRYHSQMLCLKVRVIK